jgi:hypothetical protein
MSDSPELPNGMPLTLSQKIQRRTGIPATWVAPLVLITVVVLLVVGFVLYNHHFPPRSVQSVEYTAVPIDVVEVKHGDKQRGFKILTPEWTVVSDVETTFGEGPETSKASDRVLNLSRNMANICEMAKEEGLPVTFIGTPLMELRYGPRKIDDKPVLVAKTIIYKKRTFQLQP